jgi:anti-sigma regulatory factor (Ser/Thr protein kinase)
MNQHDHSHDYYESVYTLDGNPANVSVAREHTRTFLDECTPSLDSRTADDLELVVSELVTNAVRHAPGPLTLTLSCDGHVEAAVTDTSSTAPCARKPDLTGHGGFGWHLITALTDQVKIHLTPPYGKTISAAIALP